MTPSSVLIKLLQLALGNETDHSLPKEIDWHKVVKLSYSQGVPAIAVDGYNKLTDIATGLDNPENKKLKFDWFSTLLKAESDYERHQNTLSQLKETLSEQSIRILLLKGLGLSRYYPIPNHRPTGDFDIFTYSRHLEVDKLFSDRGIEIDRKNEKHSVFDFQGITVENHYMYLDSYLTRCEKKVQRYLESLGEDVLQPEGYNTPSPLKNYFFLLCHLARHFSEYESITLRHILDWGLFLKAENDNLDKVIIRNKLKEFGLEKTNDLFVSLAEKVCGIDLSEFLINRLPKAELEYVLENILSEKHRQTPKQLVPRIRYKLKILESNNWKFRYLSITMQERVWFSVKYHLAGKAKI